MVAQELRLEDFKVPVVPDSVAADSVALSVPLAELNKKSCGVDSLRKAIGSGDTAILKGTWISKISKQGRNWVWSPKELCARLNEGEVIHDWHGRVPLVALSYCWEPLTHPDPRGEQFGTRGESQLLTTV